MRPISIIIALAVLVTVAWAMPAPQQGPRKKMSANPDDLISRTGLDEHRIEKNFLRTNKAESPFIRVDQTEEK